MPAIPGHPRISRDPSIVMGKPVIAGTRIPVEIIVRQFADGADMDWVKEGYPDLSDEDIRAALQYAADCVSVAAE
jgi:uncharacterized protein (DUF433 family)